MTAHEFRALALSFPATLEGAHVDHPDFRVRGKILASLGPHEIWGMVKLTPKQQQFVREEPEAFQPFNGAWGASGCTKVHLLSFLAGRHKANLRLKRDQIADMYFPDDLHVYIAKTRTE